MTTGLETVPMTVRADWVPGPPQGCWTVADYDALPDDGNRYEVIDGVLYMSTVPGAVHERVVFSLVQHLGIPATEQQGAFAFPLVVLMPGCDPVQPDFVEVLKGRAAIFHDRRIRGVPDLIIEVLSPSNAAFDKRIKLTAYAAAGLPEHAIVDPGARTLTHYRLQPPGRYAIADVAGEGATVVFNCLPAIHLAVADLFAGAPDETL